MKRIIIIAIIFSGISALYPVEFSGDITAEAAVTLNNGDMLFNDNIFGFRIEHFTDDLYAVIRTQIIFRNYFRNPDDLGYTLQPGDISLFYNLYPLQISLDEAFLAFHDVLINGLDLTFGKQRISWGTADMLNPTDLLNPVDLSNPFDFSRRIPSVAINLQYYLPFWDSYVQAVYQPYSQLAQLSPFYFDMLDKETITELKSFFGNTKFKDSATVWSFREILPPEANITNGLFAFKYGFSLWGFDFSLNCVYRYNDFPVLTGLYMETDVTAVMDVSADIIAEFNIWTGETNIVTNIIEFSKKTESVDIKSRGYQLGYGREFEAGFDFARDFGIFLLWGEVGVFFPDKILSRAFGYADVDADINTTAYITEIIRGQFTATTNYYITNFTVSTNLGQNIDESVVAVSNEVYVRYTVGLDKMFDGGWYINCQYSHGLFTERGNWGPMRLQDYLVLLVQKSLFADKFTVSLAGILNVNTMGEMFKSENIADYFTENHGYSVQLTLEYMPTLDIKIETGGIYFDGRNAMMGKMKDYDSVFVRFSYMF